MYLAVRRVIQKCSSQHGQKAAAAKKRRQQREAAAANGSGSGSNERTASFRDEQATKPSVAYCLVIGAAHMNGIVKRLVERGVWEQE